VCLPSHSHAMSSGAIFWNCWSGTNDVAQIFDRLHDWQDCLAGVASGREAARCVSIAVPAPRTAAAGANLAAVRLPNNSFRGAADPSADQLDQCGA